MINDLFETNKKFVYYLVDKKVKFQQYDKKDFYQEGLIALWKASLSYDSARGNSFIKYAQICIEREIIRKLKNQARLYKEELNFSDLDNSENLIMH